MYATAKPRIARGAAALAVVCLAAGASTPAAAQQPDDPTDMLDIIAELWTRGDAAGLVAHGARSGLDLEVHGQSIGPLEGRRAAAALRQLFGAQETVAVEAGSAARVVGAEDRAFGELIWIVRMPGAPITENNKIFVALVRERDRWRVSQIRILR